MTATAGYKGNLKIGANSVALVTDHDLQVQSEMYDITAMNSTAFKNYIPGLVDATVKVSCIFDFTDVNGQLALWNALLNGTLLTMTVYPDTTHAFSITAYVKQIDVKTTVNKEDSASIDLQPTGSISFA
jgi:Phage tail tube protein